MGLYDTVHQSWRHSPLSKSSDIESYVEDGGEGIPNNPSGHEFINAAKSSLRKTIDRYSITQNAIKLGSDQSGFGTGRAGMPFGYSGVLNPMSDVDSSFTSSALALSVPVETNKISRIQSYDNIARYPELEWCINEIANDFLHEDIEGNVANIVFKCDGDKYGEGADEIIKDEFRHFMSVFDLDANGYNMMRKFLIEGEICFENVIDPDHWEYGIIGAKYIPNVFYDFLRDTATGQICGLYVDPDKIKTYSTFGAYGGGANSFNGQSSTIFNAVKQIPVYTYTYSQDMKNKILMPWEQVTYMNSGVLSEDGAVVFPHIEKVVVPVRQLLLMHDAMVILRITRAPEKLLFNIDCGSMPAKEAKKYVQRFAEQRRSRKAINGSGSLTNVYNAETMLDAYYFWKTEGTASGTTVSNLQSTADYNQIHDVEYFLRRILKFLNIPWQRWAESAANRQDKNSITNEEFSFAKLIVRFQRMFASALKKSFLIHLRLRGLYDKFDINESDFDIKLNPPAIFETYQAEQRFSDFVAAMGNAANLTYLSHSYILKKIFHWTDSEIAENEINQRRDALVEAQTEFMKGLLAQPGTPASGQVYLDVNKYLNPSPVAQTGTDVQGGAPATPPTDMGGGAPMPPDANGGGAPVPAPTDMGAMGGDMGQPPPMAASAEQPTDTPSELDIPEPEVLPSDDSGIDKTAMNMGKNPSFGDYEQRKNTKDVELTKRYPETKDGLERLEKGRDMSLRDLFNKEFGEEVNSNKSLADIFADELGDGKRRNKYIKSLKSIFDTELGEEKEELSSLRDIYRDVFIRKLK